MLQQMTFEDLPNATFLQELGGWAVALQIAGWPEDKPVWTGSCPCQPFSTAGKQAGKSDERHLWPAFARLIAECRPPVVFGEQVESAIKHGWIDDLQADMEREDYAVGFAVLGAHSVGAPHIRQRLYWVADSGLLGSSWSWKQTAGGEKCCGISRVADSSKPGLERFSGDGDESDKSRREFQKSAGSVAEGCEFSRMDDTKSQRSGFCNTENFRTANAQIDIPANSNNRKSDKPSRERPFATATCQTNSLWATPDWLYCRDGKWRPVESGTFPLADGVPGRVGLLRGYGNAIVPQVAAEFIEAFMEASQQSRLPRSGPGVVQGGAKDTHPQIQTIANEIGRILGIDSETIK